MTVKRPKRSGAPENDEIELTPVMIAAGGEAFLTWSGGAVGLCGDEKIAARAIFKAMISVSKQLQNYRLLERI